MLNNIINIDLHIHSVASSYKDGDLVKNSTIDNLPVLLKKLQEYNIKMFSITDHNRFDSILYKKINDILESKEYFPVETVLPGVEFDVILEEGREKCHIIAIFNAINNKDYLRIQDVLENKKLESSSASYTLYEFNEIIKNIKLDTILIAHQKSALNRQGKHDSLGDATNDPMKYLTYIDALEYSKTSVEGILLDCLKDINDKPGLITGSDCHDWNFYPRHDQNKQESDKYFTKIKALPTFKGLLMALTSTKTRFNRKDEDSEIKPIKSFLINNKEIKFSSGINVIIGENGAGKSTLLKILNNDKDSYLKEIKSENNIIVDCYFNQNNTILIKQSELINIYKDTGGLFKDSNYAEINYDEFLVVFNKYNQDLFNYLENKILTKNRKNKLRELKINLKETQGEYYYVQVDTKNLTLKENIHKISLRKLKNIQKLINSELETGYYNKRHYELLNKMNSDIVIIIDEISIESHKIEVENKIKNIIIACINNYNEKNEKLETQASQDKKQYYDEIYSITTEVLKVINEENNLLEYPMFPKPIKLETERETKGFIFKNTSVSSNIDLKIKFFENMLNQDYRKEEFLKRVDNVGDLAKAITGASNSNYKTKWKDNYLKFIDECKNENRTIFDAGEKINSMEGNTLGEFSLVYYKYITHNCENFDLLVIDQPEDNISNKKIGTSLIDFLNLLRDKVQVIFVTHNPILVVNLDVDNVIYLRKSKNNIDIINGCLEAEDILELVANNMDGGKKMIEKRLRVYGKNN